MHIPRHPAALAASLLAIGAVGTGVAFAATNPGDQDPDFNGGAAQLVNFPAPFDADDQLFDIATQVAVAPDGSIFVGGFDPAPCDCSEDEAPDSPVSLGHLDANGNLIGAFGGDGAVTDGENLLSQGPTAFGFAANGDLLVGGSARGRPVIARTRGDNDSIDGDFTVYRYDASGRFVDQAREDFDFGGVTHSTVRGFLPLADGGQLVMGSAGDGNVRNNHFATITLGDRDTITGENVDEQTQAEALAAGHQATGSRSAGDYVIGGVGQVFTPVNDDLQEEGSPAQAWVLHRYDADGTRDESYGGEFPVDGASYIEGIDGSLAGDGATYLAARVEFSQPQEQQGLRAKGLEATGSEEEVTRFTADGKPDTTFGTKTVEDIFGDEQFFIGPSHHIDAVAGTPDGKVIVVADHIVGFGDTETVVARLNQDGSLDTTFGDGGIRTLGDPADATYSDGEDVAVQSDGKAVVAGDAGREDIRVLALRSSRAAAAGLATGEQQAYVTRLAGDPRAPVTTRTDDTPATPTTTTTAATQTTSTTQTTTTTAARPVAAQSGPKACASKRAFRIRLRIPRHVTAVSATVKVNGRQVKVLKGSRLRSTVDLKGLPKGTFKVSISVKLAHSRKTLRGTRTYHTCIPKQGDSIPVL